MAQDSIAAGVWPPSARLPDGSVPEAPDGAIQGQPNILIIMVGQMRIPRWLPAAGEAGTTALDETIYPNITGSHSLHDKGGAAYDEALNVPLYISFPTQRSGAPQEIQRYQMVSSVDLMAFLLTL
ncbi:MAG TPA: hypothetical protein VLW65_02375, partial [Bryobacteraceae bacterium]|nr:hypothetical protein [Bryobacteraceae bacterium]